MHGTWSRFGQSAGLVRYEWQVWSVSTRDVNASEVETFFENLSVARGVVRLCAAANGSSVPFANLFSHALFASWPRTVLQEASWKHPRRAPRIPLDGFIVEGIGSISTTTSGMLNELAQ